MDATAATDKDGLIESPVQNPPQKGGSVLDDVLGYAQDAVKFLRSVNYKAIVSHWAFLPTFLMVIGLAAGYREMLKLLPKIWLNDDYYSHGFLVPVIIGVILYRRREDLKALPKKSGFGSPLSSLVAVIGGGLILALVAGYLIIAYRKFDALGIWIWMATMLVLAYPLGQGLMKLVSAAEKADDSALANFLGKPLVAVFLLAFLAVTFVGVTGQFWVIASVTFILSLLVGVWSILGVRWLLAMALPVGYLVFALPVWQSVIDQNTNPLQLMSTDVAYALLKAVGFEARKPDSTTIILNNFTLDVGVPCSGMKLMLAVTAFTALFTMIGGLKLWANQLMFAIALPFCLFINGLRIMLIGVVGDLYGSEAGHQFHDYSGYLTLILCFYLLFKFARVLGWKD